jgi:hypothetical protein
MDEKVGKVLTRDDYNVLLTGPARVHKPDGSLLCVYLPRSIAGMTTYRDVLSKIRLDGSNRGGASGSKRVLTSTKRTKGKKIISGVLGSFDPAGPEQFCRLTAFTAQNREVWESMWPLFVEIGARFADEVPERYAAQVAFAARTHQDWLIPGTPFTTITINNTYPTGVHKDQGDLDEGFSCIAVARSGSYKGGVLVYPEYRLGIDTQQGDLVLMDAHEWHGNTWMTCGACGARLGLPGHRCDALVGGVTPERVSVVAYYRTKMVECASLDDENARRLRVSERRNERRLHGRIEAET